jgi:hypothetical protein
MLIANIIADRLDAQNAQVLSLSMKPKSELSGPNNDSSQSK